MASEDIVVTVDTSAVGEGLSLMVDGDKSITHRTVLLASVLAKKILIFNANLGQAVLELIEPLNALGAEIGIDHTENCLTKHHSITASATNQGIDLHLGESSAAARLLIGVLVGLNLPARIYARPRLNARPMDWIVDPLLQMGAAISYLGEEGRLPIAVGRGRLTFADVTMAVGSAQARSAVLLAATLSNTPVSIRFGINSRDHTEKLLTYMGAGLMASANRLQTEVHQGLDLPDHITIPGDPSLAAYPIALHLLRSSRQLGEVVVRNVCLNPTRTGFFDVLRGAGAPIEYRNVRESCGELVGDIVGVGGDWQLQATAIDEEFIIHSLIDEIPLICAVYAAKRARLALTNIHELSFKETNRIVTTAGMLQDCGFEVVHDDRSLTVTGNSIQHAQQIRSFDDHRISMSACILSATLGISSPITAGTSYKTSFPNFNLIMAQMGVKVQPV